MNEMFFFQLFIDLIVWFSLQLYEVPRPAAHQLYEHVSTGKI